MPPKMRFLGAQMEAYLKDGLWLDLARRANTSATQLASALTKAGAELAHPVDGNEVFAILPGRRRPPHHRRRRLLSWPDGSHRFVCSWATEAAEIEALQRRWRANKA